MLRCRQDGHRFKVLGGRPKHRRTADVDILDHFLIGHARLGGRSLERIEVADDEIDRLNAVRRDRSHVLRRVATGEQTAVDDRMESLHPSIEHLREARNLRDVADGEARVGQSFSSAAGGDEFDPEPDQSLGEIDEAGLVGNAQQGTADGTVHGCEVSRSRCEVRAEMVYGA